jgi:hypothetical protein
LLADIKQAFLNVEIDKEHWDYLRFLWYDSNSEQSQKVVYRFLRVVFEVTSSPFLLNGTIIHHLNKCVEREKAIVDQLRDDFYVDDLVSGCQVVSEGKEIYDKNKSIVQDAQCDQTFSAVITKRCAEILPNWIFFYQTCANSAF